MDVSETGHVLEPMRRWLDLLPAATFLTHVPDGQILHANRRAAELYGGEPDIPHRLWERLRAVSGDGTAVPADVDPIVKALQAGSALDDTEALIETLGGWVPVSIAIEPVPGDDGRVIAALSICHAPVRRHDGNDDFLAVLAHELRGPLAPILTAARILQLQGPPHPDLMKARETIIRQALQLTKLVDDLLDVGRISAGKMNLEKKPVELNAIVRQAVETCAPLIDRRKHTLNLALSDTPIDIDADATRVVQIVCNLLDNAAKYMHEGGRIDLVTARESGSAVVRMRDQGVGLAPEMIDRIFDRYVQVGSSRYRDQGGLGIGLSLVKALVDLHAGSIEARSDGIGKGSEFILRLPLASSRPAHAERMISDRSVVDRRPSSSA